MCKTCRRHHPEPYTDEPVAKTTEKKAPARKKWEMAKSGGGCS